MNRADAKRLAETITIEQLRAMFERAKASIKDWREPSKVNPSISMGAAWNIYYPCVMTESRPIKLPHVKMNMIWLFGDYLPDELKPDKKNNCRKPAVDVFHQDPVFEVLCAECSGEGTVRTGIAELSSTICNACDGTGSVRSE